MAQPMGSPGPLCPPFSEEMRKEDREGRTNGRRRGSSREGTDGKQERWKGRKGRKRECEEEGRHGGEGGSDLPELARHLRDSGEVDSGRWQRSSPFGQPRDRPPRKAGRLARDGPQERFFPQTKIPPLITQHITYNILIGYNMTTVISLSNNKKDVKAVSDPIKRAFIPRLIKSFNPVLSSYFESLKSISSQLAKFDPTTTKKESYLLYTASRFHYFEQYKKYFQFQRQIYDDCFKVLSKHIHFRFAEVASEEIVSKIQSLAKDTTQPVHQFDQTFKVLGDTGVLLELNYKLVHVQLDLEAKTRHWSYVSGEYEQKLQAIDGKIHFVGILFGITAIYLPQIQSDSEEKIVLQDKQEATKKEIQYINLKRELMKFIGVKKSSSYYLVFHKFHLLYRLKYREYSDKYLTQAAVKEGFFGSIGNFFKGAAGTIASGVTKAVSVASDAVDFYQKNIKPAVDILTPIVSPYLPDSINSLLKGEIKAKENAAFDSQELTKQKRRLQEATQLSKDTKKSLKQCLDFVEGKEKIMNFQLDLSSQKAKQLGIDLKQLSQSLIGVVSVETSELDNPNIKKDYIAFLYDNLTVITQKIIIKKGDHAVFRLGSQTYELIEYPGQSSYFKIDTSRSKPIDNKLKTRFKLDIKDNYSSDECFYQSLINKTIYFVGYEKQQNQRVLRVQASKILRCYRKEFYQLFRKNYSGFIFYIDQQPNTYQVISFSQEIKEEDDFKQFLNIDKTKFLIRNKDVKVVSGALKKSSSKFLEYKDYAELFEAQTSSKEASLFIEDDVKGGDENVDGESLRTQLINDKITKSSPLELIGFIHIENQTQSVFGVGLLIEDQDKKPLYLLTLKENVLYKGIGYVAVRKQQADQEGPDKISILDFSESQKYQYFQITHIVPYDEFEDYVFVMFDNSSKAPQPKTPRRLNTFSSAITKKTNFFGAFYVEFDLSTVKQTKKITVSYRDLLEEEQSSYKMNVKDDFPEKQGIFFAYKKEKPTLQSFMGFYSSKNLNRIVSPPQNTKEKIVFTKVGLNTTEISKMRTPDYWSGNTYRKFEAVGILEWRRSNGSGSLISIDGRKSSKFILTAGHNFYSQTHDLRNNITEMTFTTYKSFTGIFGNTLSPSFNNARLHIHPNYVAIIDRIRNRTINTRNGIISNDTTLPADDSNELFFMCREYDVAIIELQEQIDISNPLTIQTNQGAAIDIEGLRRLKIQAITENYLDFCAAGYPKDHNVNGINTTLKKGNLYYETVRDHIDITLKQPVILLQTRGILLPENTYLSYLLSTYTGQSGGPIFNLTTFKQIGVHGGGIQDNARTDVVNYGCFIYNPQVYNFLYTTWVRLA